MPQTTNRTGRVVFLLVATIILVGGGWWWRSARRDAGGHNAELAADRTTTRSSFARDPEVDETLRPGSITGIVTDADGRPVEGASVVLTRARGRDRSPNADYGRALQVVRTAADGAYRMADVHAGSYAVSAMAKLHAPAVSGTLDVKSAEDTRADLRLGKGGVRLSGHVYDVGGGVVPGAKVTLIDATQRSGQATTPRVYQTTTDEGGAYELSLAAAQYAMSAESDGYAPANDYFMLSRDAVRDLRLSPAARISGRVVNRATKAPVANAELWVVTSRPMRSRPRDVKSDDQGKFSFNDLAPGSYRVGARQGRFAGTSGPVSLGLAQSVSDVEVGVDPGNVVAGRVVNAAGAAIADARVQLFKDRPPFDRPYWAKSDRDGQFRIEGVLPAAFRLDASAEGSGTLRQDLQVTGDVAGLLLKLSKGASVKGQVLSAAGQPIEGAMVNVRVMTPGPMGGSGDGAVTGVDGRFSFTGLAAGTMSVSATHKDHGIAAVADAPLGENEDKALTLKLEPAGTIAGIVRMDDGRPAVGARVDAQMMRSTARWQEMTGADGTYQLKQVPAGMVTIVASVGSNVMWGGPDRPDQKQVTLVEREARTGVDLVVPGARTISGIVVGPDGAPVVAAEVSASLNRGGRSLRGMAGAQAYTGTDGSFTLEGLGVGKHTVWATQPGFGDAEVLGIEGGSTGVKLQFAPEATLAGVVLGTDGRPVSDYTIQLGAGAKPNETANEKRERQFGSPFDNPSDAVRDPEGRFFFSRVRAGDHELRVRTATGASASLPVTVAAGEKKTGLRLTVTAGARLVGRVVDRDGERPLANVDVRGMFPTMGGRPPSAKTDSAGMFAIEGPGVGETAMLGFGVIGEKFLMERRRIEVKKPGDIDVGTVRLMRGDLEARMKDGSWTGRTGITAGEDGTSTISMVRPGSPAATAGIKEGDAIVSVDGKSVSGMGTGGMEYLLNGRPGSPVTVVVQSPGAGPRSTTFDRSTPSTPPGGATAAGSATSGSLRPAGGALPAGQTSPPVQTGNTVAK